MTHGRAFEDQGSSRRNARKNTRKSKIEAELEKVVKEKFVVPEGVVPQMDTAMKFTPRGENQKKALHAMQSGKQVNFLLGTAGSGKTLIAACHASTLLRAKKIDKIYLVRPNVSCGKSNGSLPGDLESKLYPFFMQTIKHIEKFLGVGYTSYCLSKNIIEMCAIEYMRGSSFENCIIIADESQNLTCDELEMLLTRIGVGSQLILTGDQKQTDLRGNTGLVKTVDMLENAKKNRPDYLDTDDMNELLTNISVVHFTFDDVQRSPMTKALTKLYFYKQ